MRGKNLVTCAVPESYFYPLFQRVQPIVEYWGAHCRFITIDTMAFSCYSQGVLDGIELARQRPCVLEKREDELRP